MQVQVQQCVDIIKVILLYVIYIIYRILVSQLGLLFYVLFEFELALPSLQLQYGYGYCTGRALLYVEPVLFERNIKNQR